MRTDAKPAPAAAPERTPLRASRPVAEQVAATSEDLADVLIEIEAALMPPCYLSADLVGRLSAELGRALQALQVLAEEIDRTDRQRRREQAQRMAEEMRSRRRDNGR